MPALVVSAPKACTWTLRTLSNSLAAASASAHATAGSPPLATSMTASLASRFGALLEQGTITGFALVTVRFSVFSAAAKGASFNRSNHHQHPHLTCRLKGRTQWAAAWRPSVRRCVAGLLCFVCVHLCTSQVLRPCSMPGMSPGPTACPLLRSSTLAFTPLAVPGCRACRRPSTR